MERICQGGTNITVEDKKAWDHYLLETPEEWLTKALKAMINKAIKTMRKDYFEEYRALMGENISADLLIIISGIIALPSFISYNIKNTEHRVPERSTNTSVHILAGGIQIEDYEGLALSHYYLDPEIMLIELLHNKLYMRKKAFYKEYENKFINDPTISEMPSSEDDMINWICNEAGYQNRSERGNNY